MIHTTRFTHVLILILSLFCRQLKFVVVFATRYPHLTHLHILQFVAMLFALCYTALHIAHSLLESLNLSPTSTKTPVYRAELPFGIYLGRNYKANPKVFVQWGQETAEMIRLKNFFGYGLFDFSDEKTVFMRNIRLTFTEKFHEISWYEKAYKMTVEGFNSHTGKSSFDLTIKWYFDGDLIATLVRKMVYVSITTGKPIELPAEFVAANTTKSNIRFSLNKDIPSTAPETTLVVRPSDLDFQEHVGHPVYMDYLLDSAYQLQDQYSHLNSDLMSERIKCVDIEYRYQVVLGRELVVRSWDEMGDQGLMLNFVMNQWNEGDDCDKLVCLGKFTLFDR